MDQSMRQNGEQCPTGPSDRADASAGRVAGQAIPISTLLADSPRRQDTFFPPTAAPGMQPGRPHGLPPYAANMTNNASSSTSSSPTVQNHYAPSTRSSRSDSSITHIGQPLSHPFQYGPMPVQQHHVYPLAPQPLQLSYTLTVRQQPEAARACGFGERDRRVVDPPPIVQVFAADQRTGEPHLVEDSYTTLHCVLIDAATGQDASQMALARGGSEGGSAQRLMGCGVTSPFRGKDEGGVDGSFYVFSDLSVRSPGRYRLLFRLLKVDPYDPTRMGGRCPILAVVESEPFEVYTAKEFPGMKASTALLRELRRQGLNVGVKKGSNAPGRAGDVIDEEDDEDDSEDDRRRNAGRGRGRRSR